MIVGVNTYLAVLMEACKYCSLGQLTAAMFEALPSVVLSRPK